MIVAMDEDGRLMPEPDYACKVINVENGFVRDNRSWVIGCILRNSSHPWTRNLSLSRCLERGRLLILLAPKPV
jgi:hypothetical protein